MSKIYCLEFDLRPLEVDEEFGTAFALEFVESEEICSPEKAKDALKEALGSYKDDYPKYAELFSVIAKSLDGFLTAFDPKITHSENHDGVGSFTWVARMSDTRKRLFWPKSANPYLQK